MSDYESYFTSLKKRVTKSFSIFENENDGEIVQDTHLCRVLRAYYIEKGNGFPGWLPPDPKSAPPPRNAGPSYEKGRVPPGNKLDELWNKKGQEVAQPKSLRAIRPAAPSRPPESPPIPRGLPSSNERSYQNIGMSQADKVRLKLANGSKSTAPVAAPATNGYGRSAGGRDFESQVAPQKGGYVGRKGGGEVNKQEDYNMSANSPWSSNAALFGDGGYSDGAGKLPSGLAAGKKHGWGLPSGPKGPRGSR